MIQAFVGAGARQGFGPTVHVEGDALFLDGWWHAAFRVSDGAFIVRNEEPPGPSTVLDDVAAELAARGLRSVGVDLPLIQPITYTALSLGSVSWALWAADLATGEEALAARAGAESFLDQPAFSDAGAVGDGGDGGDGGTVDFSAELGGARRIAGLPPSLILTVGLEGAQAQELEVAFPDCRLEARGLEDTPPHVCATLIPSLVLVDATERAGREFVMELRADACGRFIPVVALTRGADVPLGADLALDPDQAPGTWVEPIRRLLP